MKGPFRLVRFLMPVLVLAVLPGCFLYSIAGPGYWVDIRIKDPNFKRENTAQLEEIAIRENFVKVKAAEEKDWYAIYYHRTSDGQNRLMGIIISYDEKEQLLRVSVLNEWAGQKIKGEIDAVADLYISALNRIYGGENIRVIRRRTGPPW